MLKVWISNHEAAFNEKLLITRSHTMPVKVKPSSRGKSGKVKLSAQSLFEQAQLALQFDEVEEAISLMKKAVKLEPENVEVGQTLAAMHAFLSVRIQLIGM